MSCPSPTADHHADRPLAGQVQVGVEIEVAATLAIEQRFYPRRPATVKVRAAVPDFNLHALPADLGSRALPLLAQSGGPEMSALALLLGAKRKSAPVCECMANLPSRWLDLSD